MCSKLRGCSGQFIMRRRLPQTINIFTQRRRLVGLIIRQHVSEAKSLPLWYIMAPLSEKVAIALVGGGTIASLHAEYLLSSSTWALVALIDPFPSGPKLASQLGVPHFTSIQDLLKSSAKVPDAYIICVPSSLHVPVTEDILKSSSPIAILGEKPFCTDSKVRRATS